MSYNLLLQELECFLKNPQAHLREEKKKVKKRKEKKKFGLSSLTDKLSSLKYR